jgi:hypothetical protein
LSEIGAPALFLEDGTRVPLKIVVTDLDNTTELFDAMLFAYGTQLKDLASTAVESAGNRTAIDRHVTALRELDRYSNEVYQALYSKIKSRLARKAFGERYNEFRVDLGQVISSVSGLLRGVSVQGMAQMLNAGFSAARRGMQRRLDTLALAGVAKLEESDRILMEMKFDENDVREAIGAETPLRCMITMSSPADAVLDTDVLCMTGFMTRPEVAIASADQIRVHQINSSDSTLLWSVFSDELLKGLEDKPASDKAKSIHSGFDVSTKMHDRDVKGVTSDAYRGKLNFAYPMYIHEAHWKVAKHYFPRVVAWMTTLDFAAQSFDQIKTVPFVLMGSALLDYVAEPTEHRLQELLNVMRVAWQIAKEYRLKHIQEDFDAWVQGQAGRVPKNISNLFVFMTKLMFVGVNFETMTVGDMPALDNAFWVSIFDEHVRRSIAKKNTNGNVLSDTFVADQCTYMNYVHVSSSGNIDELKYARAVNPQAQALPDSKAAYVAPTFDESKLVVKNTAIDEMLQKVLRISTGTHMIQAMRKFYEFFKDINKVALFAAFDANMGVLDETVKTVFRNFEGLPRAAVHDDSDRPDGFKYTIPFGLTDEEFYRMVVLAYKLGDNNTREASAASYKDGDGILVREVERCIQSATTRQQTAIQADFNAAIAKVFANTESVETAMGIVKLHCPNVGSPLFCYLLKELQELHDIPHREIKIKMIVDGKLVKTTDGTVTQLYRPGFCYPANKRNRKRLIFASNAQKTRQGETLVTEDEWNGMFRWGQSAHC